MLEFKKYRRTQIAEMRPVKGGDIAWFQTYGTMERDGIRISISQENLKNGSPKIGDMIARNPKNHSVQWLVSEKYFKNNFK